MLHEAKLFFKERGSNHLGLDPLSLKKSLASCSILLRLYTPGRTPSPRSHQWSTRVMLAPIAGHFVLQLTIGVPTWGRTRSAAVLSAEIKNRSSKEERSIEDAQLCMGLDTHSCKPWLYCAGFLWRPYTPGFRYPPRGPDFTRL